MNDFKDCKHERSLPEIDNSFVLQTELGEASLKVNTGRNDLYTSINRNIKLEWWDVLDGTDYPRMHMFMSADGKVGFEEKLRRIEEWAKSIQMYDEIMDSDVKVYSPEDLKNLLLNQKIPRPEHVTFGGLNKGLRRLYEELGFSMEVNIPKFDDEKRCITEWANLVKLAKTGEMLETWKKLKGKK